MTPRLILLTTALVLASCARPAAKTEPTPPPRQGSVSTPARPDDAPKEDAAPFRTDATTLTGARRQQLAVFGDLGAVHEECVDDAVCVQFGQCDLDTFSKSCVTRADDCNASAACALIGACEHVGYVNGVTTSGEDACMPTKDAHCEASLACAREGRCVAISGWDTHTCEARLDSHCATSVACTDEGRCHALNGQCVTKEDAIATCASSEPCTRHGIDCTPIDGRCRNPKDFDCAKTSGCATNHLCDSAHENVGGVDFIACHVSEEHCASSQECAERGICGVRVTNDHGKGWYKGGCALEGPTGCEEDYTRSWCAKTNEGCARSSRCASHGDCSADSSSEMCRPTEAAHCANSTNCTKHGFCTLADESSYMVCSN